MNEVIVMMEEQSKEQGFMVAELLFVIFQNEREHFTIAKFKIIETNENYEEKEIVGKGYFSNLQEGTPYSFYGHFENHPRFGLQYNIESYQTYIPDTKTGLIDYLSSDLFYGVGKKTAQRIVDHLGENAITKLLNEPYLIESITGLKQETGKQLVKTLQENQGFEHVVMSLSAYGIGLKMSQKIYEQYQEEADEIIKTDPYQLVFYIEGFGFQTADKIASQNGLPPTHESRIGAGCIYVLQQSIQSGHVFLPIAECIDQVLHLLNTRELTQEKITNQLNELGKRETIVLHENKVYLPSLFYAERGVVNHLHRLTSKEVEQETPLAELMTLIGDIEEDEVLSYGKDQFDAINQSLHSKVMIVTGGPGTGKTTVIKGILRAYSEIHDIPFSFQDYESQEDYPFILTAPTGRAAKRLNESTGLPAVTIHRLLGWNGEDYFEKNEHEQLSGKFLIVDEFSMVDTWLANHLLKAVPDDMHVLLVGDEDQLPSVGPGQVLSDLLASEKIPLIRLTEVYRQKEGSKIIQLAHAIKNDTCSMDKLKKDKDFSFISCQPPQVIDVITQVFMKANEKGINLKDIQVLAPMYRSETGITNMNRHLQQIVNPKTRGKREKKINDASFRVGDKVIQLINQPEDGVSNGDIGEIVAIFEEDENTGGVEQIVIEFDDNEVIYEQKDYRNFMHAYCISIHKSQGSEFPIVVMPVVSSYRRMLRKNLLYTAITRSTTSLIICGDQQAFMYGIQTLDTNKRYTSLTSKLSEHLHEKEHYVEGNDDTLSPYDFLE